MPFLGFGFLLAMVLPLAQARASGFFVCTLFVVSVISVIGALCSILAMVFFKDPAQPVCVDRSRKEDSEMKAQQFWFRILESQVETGTPYIPHKDAANRLGHG
jgi:hypothetical protein